ncbi:hypothetical protein ACOME3_008126 [Neoechinorhynchus agilis]
MMLTEAKPEDEMIAAVTVAVRNGDLIVDDQQYSSAVLNVIKIAENSFPRLLVVDSGVPSLTQHVSIPPIPVIVLFKSGQALLCCPNTYNDKRDDQCPNGTSLRIFSSDL